MGKDTSPESNGDDANDIPLILNTGVVSQHANSCPQSDSQQCAIIPSDAKGVNEEDFNLLGNQKQIHCAQVELVVEGHGRQAFVSGMHASIKLFPLATASL